MGQKTNDTGKGEYKPAKQGSWGTGTEHSWEGVCLADAKLGQGPAPHKLGVVVRAWNLRTWEVSQEDHLWPPPGLKSTTAPYLKQTPHQAAAWVSVVEHLPCRHKTLSSMKTKEEKQKLGNHRPREK